MSDFAGPDKGSFLAQQLGVSIQDKGNDLPYSRRIKRVRPKHKMVATLHEAGWKGKDIAALLGYTETRVSIIINSKHPEIVKARKEAENRIIDNIQDTYVRIKAYSNEMLDVMVAHARDTTNAGNSRMAARDILHMAGYSPIKRNYNVDVQIPGEEIIKAAKQIDAANEVAANYRMWAVNGESSNDDKKGG